MATLDEVATFVATACSLTVGTNLFKGQLPPLPLVCAAVYEYGGEAPVTTLGTAAIAVEYPRVQVVFRGARLDYSTPRALAETAYRAMAAANHQTITSTRYLAMEPLQAPFSLGMDGNECFRIAFNVRITKELSA